MRSLCYDSEQKNFFAKIQSLPANGESEEKTKEGERKLAINCWHSFRWFVRLIITAGNWTGSSEDFQELKEKMTLFATYFFDLLKNGF